ncbi:MAG: BREX-3 system phosphatase PglZ, partial [Chloroflexi bacterium]|nr:BREX-3 system phosphatase PglZ [Chloroflexota bacterium]
MRNWRDHILKHFTESIHRLTLVADADGLLLEEELLATIRARGFDLLPFDDVVAFRYTYEANYRRHWDDNQPTNLVVILRSPEASLRSLPYDLLQSGRQLHFKLPELFPRLSYPVVRALDPAYLQPLYEAYQTYQGPELGDQATKAFILKHVFEIDPDLTKTPLDLLKLLLSHHTRAQQMPVILDEFLRVKFQQNPTLAESPLIGFLSSATDFFAFLQAQWLNFLAVQQSPDVPAIGENRTAYTAGATLPLADSTVQVYLNTLFLEGKLKPIPLPEGWQIAEAWIRIGIVEQPEVEQAQRFNHLLQQLQQTLPTAGSLHKEWLHFAARWAELTVLRHRYADNLPETAGDTYAQFHLTVESRFADWMLDRYHTLHNQPFHNGPVMGHHLPGYLAAYRRQYPGVTRI